MSAGNWPADAAVGEVTLAFDQRHRRRIRMTDDAGGSFLFDLAKAVVLADGTLRIRDDHVLVAILEGLGAFVTLRLASFNPEPGASGDHGHSHGN